MNLNEKNNRSICWGCLSSGRKKVALHIDKLQYVIDVIEDNTVSNSDLENISFCWECAALFDKILKFKKQVKTSYQEIIKCFEKNKDITILAKPTKLNIYRVHNISIDEFNNELNVIPKDEVPKLEHESNYEDQSTEQMSEDDIDRTFIKDNTLKTRKKKKKAVNLEQYKEVMLSEEEIEKERELMLNREEFVNARFKCVSCLEIFANCDDLNDHVEVKHNTVTAHKCSICLTYLSTRTQHIHTHARRYECCICGERSSNKRNAVKHYNERHCHGLDFIPDQSALLSLEGKDEDSAMKEDITHNGTEHLFMCEHCPKKFKWKTSLNRHVVVHEIANGRKRQPYCEACGLHFTNTVNLRKHIRTSSKHQIKLKLMKLNQDSSHREEDVEDIKGRILNKMAAFSCGMCDKKFQWRGNLMRHLNSHATRASRELVCEPCNRTFSSIATYNQHMKISKKHVTELEFKYTCSDCERRFPNKMKLRDHINWEHLKNYVHKCDECQKVFKHRLNLQQHVQTVHNKNSGEHLCHLCGRAFPNKSKLHTHVTSHGTSPYKCNHCSSTFAWRACLARHIARKHRS